MVQAKFVMSQLCSCLHNTPNSDSINIQFQFSLVRSHRRGERVVVRRHLQETLSLDEFHTRTFLYFRGGTHNRSELCLPPLKCICVTICKLKILHLGLGCLVAFSGIQHMEDLRWLNTLNLLFLDCLKLFHVVYCSFTSITALVQVLSISYIRYRLQDRNLRLSTADATSSVQLKCFYDRVWVSPS